jgi:hypothetical protein
MEFSSHCRMVFYVTDTEGPLLEAELPRERPWGYKLAEPQ